MYAAHFGLKYRPFGSDAGSANVFVGPQQAKTLAGLEKDLVARDAIVTVTGPVGVGKTTMVGHALESISPERMVAWLDRTHLAADEVLDLLLTGFGTPQQGKGTIQRFTALRRLLIERAADGVPAAIVVEDAMRIGVDPLLELEALTAANTGDALSASIILMGPPELDTLLAAPELAGLHQHNRLEQTIARLDATEVHGYLTHRVSEAGGGYAAIFDAEVADIVYRRSAGMPGIVNTLCETALTRAAETSATQVSAALMRQVAAESDESATITEHAAADSAPGAIAAAEVAPLLSEVAVESGKYPNVTPATPAMISDYPGDSGEDNPPAKSGSPGELALEPESPDQQKSAKKVPDIGALEAALRSAKEGDQVFEKYAAEIGNADCLEDISDFAAETIFGNAAFDAVAAAVTAKPKTETPAPLSLQDAQCSTTANDSIAAMPATQPGPKDAPATSIMDSTAKSRLAMVRALNESMSTAAPPSAETNHPSEDQPKAATGPAPIEDQSNTAVIQERNAS